MPKINLHKLACELARKDDPRGYNASVIQTETTLKALGDKIRSAPASEGFEIVAAIARKK